MPSNLAVPARGRTGRGALAAGRNPRLRRQGLGGGGICFCAMELGRQLDPRIWCRIRNVKFGRSHRATGAVTVSPGPMQVWTIGTLPYGSLIASFLVPPHLLEGRRWRIAHE